MSLSLSKTAIFTPATVKRAKRALSCSPFELSLLREMGKTGVSLDLIAGESGLKNNYTRSLLDQGRVEGELTWLIQVGLLRREVDGQGITDSFRLTPLGKQLISTLESQGLPQPSWGDRLLNFLNRWLRLPF